MFIATPATAYVLFIIAFSTGSIANSQRQTLERPTGLHVQNDVSITTIGAPKYSNFEGKGGSGILGIGNHLDHLYTIPITLGDQVFAVNLDTGSSDLWLVSDDCKTNACKEADVARYPVSTFRTASIDLGMLYGDSKTGTFAHGTTGFDTATIGSISMPQQPFALIEDTSNLIVQFGATGIFGLGFPTASSIQGALLATTMDQSDTEVDKYVNSMHSYGPLLSRMAMSGSLDAPMFSLSIKRDALEGEEAGFISLGKLPDGIDNSSLTWVPVHLYTAEDGGMGPPSFAPGEHYPYRWEVDIDGVFLDGQRLPDSTIAAKGVDSQRVSALIDTGNSLLRGPEDVVISMLQTISPLFDPNVEGSVPTVPCNVPRTLAFQIGGQMFPIDPRDFISQLDPENHIHCRADNVVPADPPAYGSLFRWSLGTPFFKSNFVAFHYGNLTHPSVDPPRIGFRSNVPVNAGLLLQEAVQNALQFEVDTQSNIKSIPIADIVIQSDTVATHTLQQNTQIATNNSSAQHLTNYLPVLIHVAILISFYI